MGTQTNSLPQTNQLIRGLPRMDTKKVAQILTQCGFDVQVEKRLMSARGIVAIDVYAEEQIHGRKYSIACECKFWEARVPQTVIHSFRTVITEVGANLGLVISKNGFQPGSYAASDKTNLQLVTWQEFQTTFFESWYKNFFCSAAGYLDFHLRMETQEPFSEDTNQLSADEAKELLKVSEDSADLCDVLSLFTGFDRDRMTLPLASMSIDGYAKEKISSMPDDIKYAEDFSYILTGLTFLANQKIALVNEYLGYKKSDPVSFSDDSFRGRGT